MFILTVHVEMSDYLSVCMSVCFLGTFCIMHMRYSCRKTIKNNKNPNKQPTFRCQPAFRCQPDFGSHSQLLTNKLFSSFFFMRLTWASVRMMEKVLFSSFLNVFQFAGQNTQQTSDIYSIHLSVPCSHCRITAVARQPQGLLSDQIRTSVVKNTTSLGSWNRQHTCLVLNTFGIQIQE